MHSKVYYDSKADAERDGYVVMPGDEDVPVTEDAISFSLLPIYIYIIIE